MNTIKKIAKDFLAAVAAGLCIGIGGTVFLAQENKFAGAFLFSVGLLTILVFGFNLFTGMVGYLTENLSAKKWSYLGRLLTVWLGNYAGAALAAGLVRLTRLNFTDKCEAMAQTKIADDWYSLLILGVFCGILMYIAVDTFKKRIESKDFLCCIAVFMGVMVFILAGFEHSIADMYYFTLSGHFTDSLVPLLLITLGNAIGGNLIPLVQKFK